MCLRLSRMINVPCRCVCVCIQYIYSVLKTVQEAVLMALEEHKSVFIRRGGVCVCVCVCVCVIYTVY